MLIQVEWVIFIFSIIIVCFSGLSYNLVLCFLGFCIFGFGVLLVCVSFWLGVVFFLVYVGAVLVVFMFVISIYPNINFIINNKWFFVGFFLILLCGVGWYFFSFTLGKLFIFSGLEVLILLCVVCLTIYFVNNLLGFQTTGFRLFF